MIAENDILSCILDHAESASPHLGFKRVTPKDPFNIADLPSDHATINGRPGAE